MNTWTNRQRNAAVAGFLSWIFDSFDFALLVFLLSDIAKTFHTDMINVSLALILTLAARPIGALIFGHAAEKYGRRPVLMINIIVFCVAEALSALSPTLMIFLGLRFFYGVAMGGIWGVASSLVMESIPIRSRGWMSGLFQSGYSFGYLLAALAFGLFFTSLGWRGLFLVGALPILLVPFIYFKVDESPAWVDSTLHQEKIMLWPILKKYWKLSVYLAILMAVCNFFGHGTQDLYPSFLRIDHGLSTKEISLLAINYSIAAIIGSIFFGSLSKKIGHRWAIGLAAGLALVILPFWVGSSGIWLLAISSFLLQFMIQGVWGVVPDFLHAIAPDGTRAVLPGFLYQVGNLIASVTVTLELLIAQSHGGNYGIAMALVATMAAISLIVLMFFDMRTKKIDRS
jgi:MFS transporter, SHS family, lactate transporter